MRLYETAVEERWTGKQLRQKVEELRKPHAGGRPAEPSVKILMARMARLLKGFDVKAVAVDRDRLMPGELRHLASQVREAEALLARIRKALAAPAGPRPRSSK